MNYVPRTYDKKLAEDEVQNIRSKYLELKSIDKVAKTLGHAKNTVNKYVKDLSSLDKRSRNNNIAVFKIDAITGKIIGKFKNANSAATMCHIAVSNLNQCLSNKTNSAGGFCWCYANKYKNFKLPNKIHTSYVREEDILLGLK
jgi:6-phosphogluconolactonase (cycloisomerase 2 family)